MPTESGNNRDGIRGFPSECILFVVPNLRPALVMKRAEVKKQAVMAPINHLRSHAAEVVWPIVFTLCLSLSACRQPSEQVRSRVGKALQPCLLALSELPDGWEIGEGPRVSSMLESLYIDAALGGQMINFVHSRRDISSRAVQHLLLFKTRSQATDAFKSAPTYERYGMIVPWRESDQADTVLAADEFFLACATVRSDSGVEYIDCTSSARYDRFFTSFSSRISPEYMFMEEYVQVLQAIDRRMLHCNESHIVAD